MTTLTFRSEIRMGTQQSTVDSRSPDQIAKAIVKVNKTPELRRAGLRALWKLYCAPQHSVARAELENEFGLLEDNFGLYSRGVVEQLSLDNPGALALLDSSHNGHGVEMLTLKPSVVSAIRSHAFLKMSQVTDFGIRAGHGNWKVKELGGVWLHGVIALDALLMQAAGRAETCPYDTLSYVRKEDVKAVLGRVLTWPKPAQEKAVASLRAIEHEWVTGDEYNATPEELEAIDEADCSEGATDDEVEAAFRFFGAASGPTQPLRGSQ
jgi:hypothetical protein